MKDGKGSRDAKCYPGQMLLYHSELSYSFIAMTTADVGRCVHAYSAGDSKGHDGIR